MAQKKKPTRGATRSKEGPRLPALVLLGSGFIFGVLATLVVVQLSNQSPAADEITVVAKKSSVKEPQTSETTVGTKFDFFTLLPEREIIVTDDAPRSKTVNTSSRPAKERSRKPNQSSEKFNLQAGSFRHANEADRRRAQILILGLDAKVEAVEANGDRWYRVYVGPFRSHNTLSSARAKLIDEGIDTLVVKQKS